MRIIAGFPPNFRQLHQRFNIRGKPVFITYGDVIYNPMRVSVPPEVVAHEEVHAERQLDEGVAEWWRLYLEDDEFRLQEELAGHRAEVRYVLDHGLPNAGATIDAIAARLAGPLYGHMVTFDLAKRMITP